MRIVDVKVVFFESLAS